jgi:hypothetical protein
MRPKKANFFMKGMGSFALSMKRGLVHARLEARVNDRCCETYHRGTIKEKQFRTFTSHALYSEVLLFLIHDILSRPLYFTLLTSIVALPATFGQVIDKLRNVCPRFIRQSRMTLEGGRKVPKSLLPICYCKSIHKARRLCQWDLKDATTQL